MLYNTECCAAYNTETALPSKTEEQFRVIGVSDGCFHKSLGCGIHVNSLLPERLD